MNGYSDGSFGPNDHLTRAQLAQILYNKENRPAVGAAGRFSDVSRGAWYAKAVNWAADQGIVTGYSGGRFGPEDNITREQLAVMLWRYAGEPAPSGSALPFPDANQVSGYAREALRWATENHIVNGSGGRLLPKGLSTRAEVAQMLKNYLG